MEQDERLMEHEKSDSIRLLKRIRTGRTPPLGKNRRGFSRGWKEAEWTGIILRGERLKFHNRQMLKKNEVDRHVDRSTCRQDGHRATE